MDPAKLFASPLDQNVAIIAAQYSHQMDAELAPSLAVVPDARVVPVRRKLPRGSDARDLYPTLPDRLRSSLSDGGVYDREGVIVTAAMHLKGAHLNLPLPSPEPEAADQSLAGTWIYGGRLQPHFGHFLTESLGRLWCLEEVQAYRPAGILFVWHRPEAPSEPLMPVRTTWPFVAKMLDLLGIAHDVMLANAPTRVERLLVPSQLMRLGDGPRMAGHERFRQFVGRLADHAAPMPAAGPSKLFVSRSRLAEKKARPLLEDWMDGLFAEAGYSVIHPETMTIEDQIAAYRAARQVVFTEGSALHLFALVADPAQRVAIIQRTLPASPRFRDQLVHAHSQDVTLVEAVASVFLPRAMSKQGLRYLKRSRLEPLLDFGALVAQLQAAGFLPATTTALPSEQAVRRAIRERREELSAIYDDCDFTLVPRERINLFKKKLRRRQGADSPTE